MIPWWGWALLTAGGMVLLVWVTTAVFTLAPVP
jgi:hypothetical protein